MAQIPEWTPLREVAPPLPSEDGAGRVVALLASDAAANDGWAPTAALALANEWAGQGQRIMLVDGALTAPAIHDAAGVVNREGLSDAVLYGASIERVAHPLPGGGGFLVTVGTPVATGSTVAGSPKWERLRDGMSEAGVTLLLYLVDSDESTPTFLNSTTDVVVLAAPEDAAPSRLAGHEASVRAVAGPPHLAGAADSAADHEEVSDPASDEMAFVPEGDDSAADVAEDSQGLPEELAASVRPVVTSGGGGVSMILFVVLAVIAAAAWGWFMISGLG